MCGCDEDVCCGGGGWCDVIDDDDVWKNVWCGCGEDGDVWMNVCVCGECVVVDGGKVFGCDGARDDES